MEINYQRYSLKELLQAKQGIDREKYPENYKRLMEELSNRDDEIKEHISSKEESTFNKLKILGYLQLAAAIVLTLIIVSELVEEFSAPKLLFGLGAIGLNSLAGLFSVQEKTLGYRLSLLNQGLQSAIIVSSNFAYGYSGIGGIYLTLREGFNVSATFKPGFSIVFGNVDPPYGFSIDVLAVFFIFILLTGIEIKEQNHANNTP